MHKIIILIITSFIFSLDFSNGPYGSEYFDTAAPFTVQDLNATPAGDITGDDILNIQDIVLMISYVIGNVENIDWFEDGDINNDNIIDILDIVSLINIILNSQDIVDDITCSSDINFDQELDILDVVLLVNIILN